MSDTSTTNPALAARDELCRARQLVDLIALAAETLLPGQHMVANAICAGCNTLGDKLDKIANDLDAAP
jgi:hypothetical protein